MAHRLLPLLPSLLIAGWSSVMAQQAYPTRPVTVIIPYTAGGNTDVMARAFLDIMQRTTGMQTVVVNRDGGGGTLGFSVLKSSAPDGYTVVFSPSSPLSSAPHLIKKLPFVSADFVPICQVFENIYAIAVAPNSKYKTLAALLDDIKARPGAVSFATAGIGSIGHLAGEDFARAQGVKILHVPFRGDGQMVPQVLGGQVDFAVAGMGSAATSMRPLAVFSDTRIPFLPAVPTMAELGLPSSPPGYQGLFAPKGTPPNVIATLEKNCASVATSEAFKAAGARQWQKVHYVDGAGFAKRIAADYEYKGRVIKEVGIAAE